MDTMFEGSLDRQADSRNDAAHHGADRSVCNTATKKAILYQSRPKADRKLASPSEKYLSKR
jgi:hypothetical protein